MQTERESLTHRYGQIITALIRAVGKHNRVLPLWLFPVFDKLIKTTHMRAIVLLSRLLAGTYRQPRKRTTPRSSSPPKPPVFIAPVFIPPGQRPTTGWMWLS